MGIPDITGGKPLSSYSPISLYRLAFPLFGGLSATDPLIRTPLWTPYGPLIRGVGTLMYPYTGVVGLGVL